MAVEPLANVAGEGDEVRRAEDVVLFFEADAEHGEQVPSPESTVSSLSYRAESWVSESWTVDSGLDYRYGGSTKPSRSAANRAAAIKSAVVPGLRRCPSLRSQKSKSASA